MLRTQQLVPPAAWVRLLRAYASARRVLSAQLEAEHALTINDFEALLRLAHAEDGRMRRVDLADELMLTASGVTRLLEGLEAEGFVERASCASDRRVVYAVITEAGREKLRDAADSHIAAVRALFEERFDAAELAQLTELLGRLPGAAEASAEDCAA